MTQQAAFTQPCITLLYRDAQLHFPDTLQMALDYAAVDGSPHPENLQVVTQVNEPDRLAADFIYLDHKIRILGASLPLPKEVMARCLQASHWQGDFRKQVQEHRTQVVLSYSGGSKNPTDKMVMLYKLAHALRHESLVGIVNEPAWTAHPILDTLQPERIRSYHESLPFLLWFGYLRVEITPELYFLVSRGHGVFNLPDLATLVEAGEDVGTVMHTFFNVFYYLAENKGGINPGDTLEMSGSGAYLRVSELPELPVFEQLRITRESTLLLEKSAEAES